MKISEFVFASLNDNKVQEVANMVGSYQVKVYTASQWVTHLPPEDGATFKANALIKAQYVAKISGMAVLGDDSGLCVEALQNAPGIYSARWAGEEKNYRQAINKIQLLLKGTTNYKAKFVTVLALSCPNKEPIFFMGECYGTLSFPPRGENGFAYDVIFAPNFIPEFPPKEASLEGNKVSLIPNTKKLTFAELEPWQKNMISHRFIAFSKFAQACLIK